MRKVLCALAMGVVTSMPLQAQTLKDAYEAAWRRSAAGAADTARAEEANARRDTARNWLRESPSIAAGYKTDRIDKNSGAREMELELGVPLALPSERRANIEVGDNEARAVETQRAVARLKLAQEVRESFWAARLAQIERELAQRRLDEATQLAADLTRRLKVGEAARVDANQARSTQLASAATLRVAQLEEQRAVRAFAQLTGLPQLTDTVERPASEQKVPDEHPLLAQARAAATLAHARADQATAIRRDTPELTMTLSRERGEFTASYAHAIRFGVKVPLGGETRNRTRIAQTGAERIEADAALVLEVERLKSDLALARDELSATRDTQAAAEERARLAADTQQLVGRAFALGERDLAARLRADAERYEAELAAARAQAEFGRAISRFNQALGLLP